MMQRERPMTLDELIRGENVRRIRLRKGDELQDLADKINKVISMIEDSKGPNSRKADKDHPAT